MFLNIYVTSVANNRTSSFMQFETYKSICNVGTRNSISDNILVFPSEEPLMKSTKKWLKHLLEVEKNATDTNYIEMN